MNLLNSSINKLFVIEQSDEESLSSDSGDDSSVYRGEDRRELKRGNRQEMAGMEIDARKENDTDSSGTFYSAKDANGERTKRRRKIRHSDDDTATEGSHNSRNIERAHMREENERTVRMKIDALYENIYANQTFKDEEKSVHRDLRQVVREYIWPKTKFVKGEGHFVKKSNRFGRKQKKKKAAVMYGTSHEQPNLHNKYGTKGYQSVIMKKMNLHNQTDKEKAYFWKTYEGIVKDEIQKLRNNKATDIKKCMMEGTILKN